MDWHKRFIQQAAWTSPLRDYLFKACGLATAENMLEVGCGTGALLARLVAPAHIHAIDLDQERLLEAHQHAPVAQLIRADVLSLPYLSGAFEITFCHFLLLWVHNPLRALLEMKRVTRSGGSVLALAEPDYSARLDRPDELAPLGRWQTQALQRQGAHPDLGGRLAELFEQAGLQLVETGRLQSSLQPALTPADRDLEWAVLEADLDDSVPTAELQRLKRLDKIAWESNQRVLYVPTYFAWGQVGQMV